MVSVPFDAHPSLRTQDAVAHVQPHAPRLKHPHFNCQHLIVAGGTPVAELDFEDRENQPCRLPVGEGFTHRAKPLTPGRFEEFEVAAVVNVVSHGAVGIGDPVAISVTFHCDEAFRKISADSNRQACPSPRVQSLTPRSPPTS